MLLLLTAGWGSSQCNTLSQCVYTPTRNQLAEITRVDLHHATAILTHHKLLCDEIISNQHNITSKRSYTAHSSHGILRIVMHASALDKNGHQKAANISSHSVKVLAEDEG